MTPRSFANQKVFEKTEDQDEDCDEKPSEGQKFNFLRNQENHLQDTHYYDHTALYWIYYVDWRILEEGSNVSRNTEQVDDVNDPVGHEAKYLKLISGENRLWIWNTQIPNPSVIG